MTFNQWMPFSGTGMGRGYDTYRARSSYSPAFLTNHTFSERNPFGDEPEKMVWLKGILEEYLKVRPYMTEDFYPLTQVSDRNDIWSAAQFDRLSEGDGIVHKTCDYVFTDADDGSEVIVSGKELVEKGFVVNIEEKRMAKLFFYKKI